MKTLVGFILLSVIGLLAQGIPFPGIKPPASSATISRVQSKSCLTTAGTTTLTCTFDTNTTAGNFLVAFIADNGGMTGLSFVNGSDTFTLRAGNAQIKAGFQANATGGSATVVASWTGTVDTGMVVVEYHNVLNTGNPDDGITSRTQGGGANTTWDTLGLTTTGANDLLVSGVNNVSSNTTTATSTASMTSIIDLPIPRAGYRLSTFERLNMAANTYSSTGNFSAGSSYGADILGFKGL